ncbi:unnamed protein product [Soboliphyme baturini]|uniref:Apple domain-containing protein n=1 Tax=Soboliphyme baturini TaxID=241478 RepID=A0A183J2V0_9BILA|nr:unnamed protein product [Soboliphyme baturini]
METRGCRHGRLVFRRFANHVLVGFADVVIRKASIYNCFCACASAMMHSDDNCRSFMFFYDSNECILNKASRLSHPSNFALETKAPRVDYFDRVCEHVNEPANLPGKCVDALTSTCTT